MESMTKVLAQESSAETAPLEKAVNNPEAKMLNPVIRQAGNVNIKALQVSS